MEIGSDFAVLYTVVDVGQNPVFNMRMDLSAAVNEGDACAVPPKLECCNGGRILTANDYDI